MQETPEYQNQAINVAFIVHATLYRLLLSILFFQGAHLPTVFFNIFFVFKQNIKQILFNDILHRFDGLCVIYYAI